MSLKKSLTFFAASTLVAFLSAYFWFPQTVHQKLLQKKYEILTTDQSNNHHWQKILESYKQAKFNKRNLKLANFDPNKENEPIGKLQKICKDLIKEFLRSDKDNYRRAAKWCVAPVTAREILSRRGIKALEATDSSSKWELKIVLYRINKNPRKKDKSLSEKLGTIGSPILPEMIQHMQKECNEKGATLNHDAGSHHARDIFEAWCSAN